MGVSIVKVRQEPLTLMLDSDQNLHPVTDRPVTLGWLLNHGATVITIPFQKYSTSGPRHSITEQLLRVLCNSTFVECHVKLCLKAKKGTRQSVYWEPLDWERVEL